jgi:hypothetical protein
MGQDVGEAIVSLFLILMIIVDVGFSPDLPFPTL